jgi:hypothetical protein
LHVLGGGAGFLKGGQQNGDQQGYDADDHEEFHQSKSMATRMVTYPVFQPWHPVGQAPHVDSHWISHAAPVNIPKNIIRHTNCPFQLAATRKGEKFRKIS